jgi:hypothetical protein
VDCAHDAGERRQVKLQVARSAGKVRELTLHKVPPVGGGTHLEPVLSLDRDGAARLIELVRAFDHIPVEGGEETVRVDDQLLRDIFADPSAVRAVYERDPAPTHLAVRGVLRFADWTPLSLPR